MIVTTKQSHFGVEVQSFVSAITQPKIISGPDYYNSMYLQTWINWNINWYQVTTIHTEHK